MTATLALEAGLALLVVAVAAWAVAARQTFAAVVGYIAYGLLLSVVWVSLGAVDVSLTEAAIGGGLTGALLIGAAARLRRTEAAVAAERPLLAVRVLAALVAALVAATIAAVVVGLPEPGPTLAPEAAEHLPALGLGNAITAVLLAYRAMDTLLESIVLVFALVGVWSLAPDRAWGGRPEMAPVADPDGVLSFAARLLVPVAIVVALYIFWTGADHPGGKFQGATILAAMWLLCMMAGLAVAPPVSRRRMRALGVAGPLVFIAVGLAGVLVAGAFLGYPEGYAKPLIIAIEAVLLPSIALTLGLLVAGAPARPEPP